MKTLRIFSGRNALRLQMLLAFFTLHSSLYTLRAQPIGDVFYIYRNDGQFNAFFRDEVQSIEYSYEDADGNRYDEIVTQIVNTADSVYRIPLAAIDSVAFGVNEIHLSKAYVPISTDGYVVEEADTMNSSYLLRFLHTGDIISVENDTLAVHVHIQSLSYPDESHVRIVGEKATLADVFTGGTFTLSTETDAPAGAKYSNVFYPEEIIYSDSDNRLRRIRRRANTSFTQRLYSKTIDYSGTDIHKTDYTRLYLEACRFDFNLDLVVTCNFSSKEEALDNYAHGELALQKSVIRGTIDTDFMLRFDANAQTHFDGEEIMLRRNIHKPVLAKFVVGSVPILVEMSTHLMMDASYDAEGSFSAYTGFTTSNTAELGFSWTQASGLRPNASYNSSFTFHKPTIEGKAHLESKVTVFPRISFSLYGLVGPSFDIKPYLKPVLDLGFYDQMGSNKQDFYGAKCDIFTGYDAAVGLTFLASRGNKPAVKSPSWNVVDKMILESPKDVKFEKGEPETLTPGKPMVVSFHVSEYDHIFNRSLNAELPFAVKFETNSGTLSSDFALVDTSTGLATVTWTPASESSDGKDAYIVAMMHDHDGNVITADRWTPEKGESSCPDEHHPHLIDLGLPSGTKWACCNVGASAPEQYGGYFAWGETIPKSYFHWDNYSYYDSNTGDYIYIGSDISGTRYDAATANWGSPWVMPSREQMDELLNNCTSEWTTENGVNGRRFTGPNGASIFLPASGYRWYGDLSYAGSYGYCWSSSLGESDTNNAYELYFRSGVVGTGRDDRLSGLSVRPVRKN